MRCDPCAHCIHYAESYDGASDWVDSSCAKDEEGDKCPCPSFTPRLASDGLFEQLDAEWMEACE